MFLSEVPYDEIPIGLKVIPVRGIVGEVIEKRSPGYRGEDNDIVIWWKNGNTTDTWHFWCSKITVAENT